MLILKSRPAILALALALAITLGACNRDQDKPATVSRPTSTAATAEARKPVFPEPEAAAILRAISNAEIAMATAALDISQSDAVIGYSRVISADYRGIAQLVDSTATALGQLPTDNALSTELQNTGDSITAGLRRLPRGFNNTFIEEQVKVQQRAVQLMDTALIPSARTPQLRTLFQAIRPTMVAHLQRSLQILDERRAAARERGEPWESGLDLAPAAAEPRTAPPAEAPYVDPYPIRPPRDTTRADTIPR